MPPPEIKPEITGFFIGGHVRGSAQDPTFMILKALYESGAGPLTIDPVINGQALLVRPGLAHEHAKALPAPDGPRGKKTRAKSKPGLPLLREALLHFMAKAKAPVGAQEATAKLAARGYHPPSVRSCFNSLKALKRIVMVSPGVFRLPKGAAPGKPSTKTTPKRDGAQADIVLAALQSAFPQPVKVGDLRAIFRQRGLREDSVSVALENLKKNKRLAKRGRNLGEWLYTPPKETTDVNPTT